ncbi:MAG: WYL domain-containing protein [Acidimicrobiia bacterium]|nr:WYL domain-containing protein [Acidimicrobiia bacterium]
MAGRPTAPDRMRRVLAVVPWIVANPGRKVSEVAERFGLTEQELLDDLNVVFMVGLPPYSPDALVDVQIDADGGVSISLADFFSRPLRLTPSQGLALLASSDGLLSMPGTDPEGALARALDKLGKVVGVGPDDALDIHLGHAEATMLDTLRGAATRGTEVAILYYSYGRDERTSRTIVPWRVFADGGSWYVHGWCNLAGGERVFRIDRIESLEVLDTFSDHRPPEDYESVVFQPRADDPTVTIELEPEASWIVDAYPVTVLEITDGDPSLVRMVVTEKPWLERLLVRLGPAAEVVDATGLESATSLAAEAASRILARYRRS